MNKVSILVSMAIVLILLSCVVSAEEKNLGTFKQGNCVILKQTCSNCSFVNITSITMSSINGESIQLLGQVEMTKIGTEYNYSFCNTMQPGEYTYNTIGDDNGILVTQPVTFDINSSNLALMIIIIIVVFVIGFFGFFGKHQWISALGGLGMIALGIFTVNNGIDTYRNFITNVFSWTTIGIGVIFALIPIIEFIQENY